MLVTAKTLRGKRVAITGEGRNPRRELVRWLRKTGAIFTKGVSRQTDFLVMGEPPPGYRSTEKRDIARSLIDDGASLVILPMRGFERLVDDAGGIRISKGSASAYRKARGHRRTARVTAAKQRARPRSTRLPQILRELPDDLRRRCERWISSMVRSASLRPGVLRQWGHACVACGMALKVDDEIECEVAHVHEVKHGGPDKIGNGVPLCRSHHWAFDRYLWAIEPAKLQIRVAKRAANELRAINGRKVRRPRSAGGVEPLASMHVAQRWARFLRAVGGVSGIAPVL